MRRARIALALSVLGLAAAPAWGAESTVKVREAGDATFPDRSYVLTLPERKQLAPGDVRVTENGVPVTDFRLLQGTVAATGVVLAIDASTSMKGQTIKDAMAAARTFAENRRPEQRLGVVFFSGTARVALKPTTDAAAIDQVLADIPTLSGGTQIAGATKAAVDLLEAADVPAGSVVLLSDGCRASGGRCTDADAGAAVTLSAAAKLADTEKVNVFAVGLRSPTYDEQALRTVASAGGYIEVSRSSDLASIYDRLGRQFANEYVVRWKSLAPVGSRVGVGFEIAGYSGIVAAAYQVPDLRLGVPITPTAEESFWRKPLAGALVAVLVALFVGVALMLVVRQRRKSVGERIASFVFEREEMLPRLHHDAPGLFERLEAALDGKRYWDSFKLDVELSKVKPSPLQIVAMTVTATLFVSTLAWLIGRTLVAVVALILIPVIARLVIKRLADLVRRRFADQLPDNLQVMSSALRAGHSFVGALKTMVNDAPEPSRSEYGRVLTDEQLGVPIEDSMNVVAARMKNEEVSYVGLIATLQRETGGNTAEVLDRVVITIRERMKLRRMIRTLTAQGRLGGWIVTALPIAMLVFLNLVQPDYMDPMTETTLGWVILVFAGLMVALGAFVIRKIVDIRV